LKRLDRSEVITTDHQISQVVTAEAVSDTLIDEAFVLDRAFPTHAAEQSDPLHILPTIPGLSRSELHLCSSGNFDYSPLGEKTFRDEAVADRQYPSRPVVERQRTNAGAFTGFDHLGDDRFLSGVGAGG
jgi:hypothetical protein